MTEARRRIETYSRVMGAACSGFCTAFSLMRKDGTLPEAELLDLLRTGQYTIIDARGHDYNNKNGLPGSVSVPSGATPEESKKELDDALKLEPLASLPKDALLLCHCDGGLYAASTRAAFENAGYTNAKNAGGWGTVKRLLQSLNPEEELMLGRRPPPGE